MANDFEVGAVRVKNLGSQPPNLSETLDLYYEGNLYRFEPGSEALVPEPASRMWFGDNSIPDNPHLRHNRTDEVHRLMVKYGLEDAPTRNRWGLADPSDGFPKVKVTDYEGKEVTMLIHDLEGKTVRPATSSEAQQEAYEDRIALLERELKSLKASREMNLTPQNPKASDVPEDSPERGRDSGRSRGRAS